MHLDQDSLRFIFGLKLKTLRKEKGLSLKSLATTTGLSASYINEIEKGKKYPRGEKILSLANALGSNYDELTSIKLEDDLKSFSTIFENNLIKGLPFDIFGIEPNSIFKLLAETPDKSGALMGTVLDLARNYGIRVESVFLATLRAYLDMNNNFFDDIEKKAQDFEKKELKDQPDNFLNNTSLILKYLKEQYACKVSFEDFQEFPVPMKNFTYILKQQGPSQLLILNQNISERKKRSLLMQEIAYRHFKIKERRVSPLEAHLDSYQQLYNDFFTNYFASALLVPSKKLGKEIKNFFQNEDFQESKFLAWMQSYPCSHTMFFERLTQCIPKFLGVKELFLLKLIYNKKTDTYDIDRELHLSTLHSPHRVESDQHYCRRWLSTTLVNQLKPKQETPVAATQVSNYTGTQNKYLCFSAAWQQQRDEDQQSCCTIGIFLNQKNEKVFPTSQTSPTQVVCSTCEACPLEDCKIRQADNILYKKKQQESEILEFIAGRLTIN